LKKVITYGSFDLFHEGHYRLLERAKALGDYLIVGVTTEQYDQYRGKLNVIDSLTKRMDNVRASGFADEVIVEDRFGQKVEDIKRYGVDVFAIGSDWVGAFDYLKELCEVVYLERTKEISSSILRIRQNPILKVGIIGSGRIAGRLIPESKFVSGLNIEGVYNPNFESALNFQNQFELGFASDNLEDFLSHVDAVYIASPHHTHVGYTTAALNLGKHVLCEKPLAFTKAEAATLFSLARQHNLVLMEAIKTAYSPGFVYLSNIVKSGLIGSVRDVEACFTKLVPDTSREWHAPIPGAFAELASYPLFAIAKILGTDYIDVNFSAHRDTNGTDYYSKAYFTYNNSFATAKVGIGVKSEGEMIVSGTKGYVVVKSPWWKTEHFEVRFENPTENEAFYMKFFGDGLRYELNEFASAINGHGSGKIMLTEDESEFIAEIIDKFLS